MRLRILILTTCLSIGLLCSWATAQTHDDKVDFDRQIRPILSDRCYFCHGPDSESRAADLRLDMAEEAEYVIEAGNAEASELFRRITSDDDSELMPPPESKLTITEDEKALIKRWIEQGAEWKQHWAFERPLKADLPQVVKQDWANSPIDRFTLAVMEANGLAPSPPASKSRLLRRISFDLTGLPPTLEELDAFMADQSETAFEQTVDRLLSSPRFGERMASVWLDAARYSDSYGYQVDRDRTVWPWRDWVINAINQNMTYDQFLIDQLAGDLLPNATDEQRLATTFNRLHPQKVEGGSVEEEFRVEYVADRTQTMGTAVMGLTLECARCHDHKYDPISQKEFYQLFSYFNNIDEAGLYSYFTNAVPSPSMLLMNEQEKNQLANLRAKAAEQEAQLETIQSAAKPEFQKWLQEQSKLELATPDSQLDFEKVNEGGNEKVAEGPDKNAIRFTGDDEVKTDFGNYRRYQPFSIAARIHVPDKKKRAVILHRSRAWTDAASRGYQWLIENGKLSAALIHFWPGNAIGIETVDDIPVGRWLNVVMTYDGSSRANGIKLYLDGERIQTRIVRDNLVKNITGGGGDQIALGARFRDNGFKGGMISSLAAYEHELTEADVRLMSGMNDISDQQRFQYYLHHLHQGYSDQRKSVLQARKELSDFLDKRREIMVMDELASPRPAYVLSRGLYDQRTEEVSAGTPSVLPASTSSKQNRLELARWLTRPDHPLTSRVAVNRIWQMLFGEGLVGTPEDFGRQGSLPTHPELLDWLAVDFVEHGWDVKRLVKQIVMSKTYCQSSEVTGELLEKDPGNEFLSRGPSYRLPAEMIRDNALFVSGLLVDKIGGRSVKPYEVAVSFKPATPDQGEGLYRRSLYTYWRRTAPAPVMMALDASKRDVCQVKRERTSSPLQSLVLLNGPQFVEAARKLAETFVDREKALEVQDGELISVVFRALTSRAPSAEETKVIARLLQQQHELFQADEVATKEFLDIGNTKSDLEKYEAARLAAWTSVINTLMSHDECVTKR